MHKFSAIHCETVCSALSLDQAALRRLMERTESVLPDRLSNGEPHTKWRSLRKFVGTDEIIRHQKTRLTILEILSRIGFPASEEWLAGSGRTPPAYEMTVPKLVIEAISLDPNEQYSIGEHLSGFYCLYRRYGADDRRMVREVVHISDRRDINPTVLLFNRRGAAYKGYAYKTNYVLYVYLFRAHAKFSMSGRVLYLAVPASGDKAALGGLILRIRRTSGAPGMSDCILLKMEDDPELRRALDSAADAFSDAPFAAKHVPVESVFPEYCCPRDFRGPEEMTDQERLIYRNLRDVIRVRVPDEVAELGLKPVRAAAVG